MNSVKTSWAGCNISTAWLYQISCHFTNSSDSAPTWRFRSQQNYLSGQFFHGDDCSRFVARISSTSSYIDQVWELLLAPARFCASLCLSGMMTFPVHFPSGGETAVPPAPHWTCSSRLQPSHLYLQDMKEEEDDPCSARRVLLTATGSDCRSVTDPIGTLLTVHKPTPLRFGARWSLLANHLSGCLATRPLHAASLFQN